MLLNGAEAIPHDGQKGREKRVMARSHFNSISYWLAPAGTWNVRPEVAAVVNFAGTAPAFSLEIAIAYLPTGKLFIA